MEQKWTEKTTQCLKNGGWTENRKVEAELVRKKIVDEGYPVLPSVLNFLCLFEGLEFSFFNIRRKKQDDFNFSIEKASHLVVPEKVRYEYEVRIGRSLCIIGTAYRENFVLLMDEKGFVFGAYDNYLVQIGANYIEAINNIIEDIDFTEIP